MAGTLGLKLGCSRLFERRSQRACLLMTGGRGWKPGQTGKGSFRGGHSVPRALERRCYMDVGLEVASAESVGTRAHERLASALERVV